MLQTTPDLYFVATLLCNGIQPVSVRGTKNHPCIAFEVTDEYKTIVNKFFRGELLINPLEFQAKLKQIKSELHLCGELSRIEYNDTVAPPATALNI